MMSQEFSVLSAFLACQPWWKHCHVCQRQNLSEDDPLKINKYKKMSLREFETSAWSGRHFLVWGMSGWYKLYSVLFGNLNSCWCFVWATFQRIQFSETTKTWAWILWVRHPLFLGSHSTSGPLCPKFGIDSHPFPHWVLTWLRIKPWPAWTPTWS